jgi:hypothetical protein
MKFYNKMTKNTKNYKISFKQLIKKFKMNKTMVQVSFIKILNIYSILHIEIVIQNYTNKNNNAVKRESN